MTPILITGASGTLGRAFVKLCHERGLAAHATSRDELDITHADAVDRALARHAPWLVVNAAGYTRVDDAEREPARCYRENVIGPEVLAQRCCRDGVRFLVFSSDLVFDGEKDLPYEEHDRPAPLGVYGRTKRESELRVLARCDRALVIRTGACFAPWNADDFVATARRELAAGRTVAAAADTVVSPTYIPDLVHACLDLAIDGEAGVWHLANAGALTWAEIARLVAVAAGHDQGRITPVERAALGWRAPRPRFSALRSARGMHLPPLGDALRRHHDAC